MNANGEKKNFVVRGLEIFGDIFAINVAFVICSLPIFTIGASLSALYAMSMRIVKKEDGPLVQGFMAEFKRNFKQGTLAWLIVLAATIGIWGELYYMLNYTDTMASVYMVVVAVECVIYALTIPFVFPLIARYENTLWNTFKNAFLLAVSNLGKWVKVFLAWFAPIFICFYEPVVILSIWYLWLIFIFGLIAYGTSHSMLKVFERVDGVKEQKEEYARVEAEKHNSHGEVRKRAMISVSSDEEEESDESQESGE